MKILKFTVLVSLYATTVAAESTMSKDNKAEREYSQEEIDASVADLNNWYRSMSPQEKADHDNATRLIRKAVEEEEREEFEAWEAAQPKVLQLGNGVDSALIPVVKAIDEYFFTDEKGRVLSVGVLYTEKSTESIDTMVRRLAPLKHLESFDVSQSGDIEDHGKPEDRLSEDAFLVLQNWHNLKKLGISLVHLDGKAFLKLVKKNPLRHLEEADIGVERNADCVLEALKNCTKLRRLELRCCDLTDASLQHLSNLKKLDVLDFSGTKITGSGLRALRNHSSLVTIYLEEGYVEEVGMLVTDEALEHLGTISHLKTLTLVGKEITDAGVAHLQNLKELDFLSIGNSSITAKAFEDLVKLPKLTTLYVKGNTFGDEAISTLSKFRNLASLNLIDTDFTEAGIAKLRAQLPQCQISSSFDTY